MHAPHYTHCQPASLLEKVGNDHAAFLHLVELFMLESSEKIAGMRRAANAGDLAQLGYNSHALKGTVGPFDADALVQVLLQIEKECASGQCLCDEARWSSVNRELVEVQREVQHFVAQL